MKKRMRIKCSARFFLCKRIFTRTMVIRRTWIRKEMVFYSRIQSTRWLEQNCRANDVDTRRKQTPSLPIHESSIQRSAQKQRWWKIVNTLLRRPRNDWNCFSHKFLLMSSVLREQSQKCVKNVTLAMMEQGDLLWNDNLTHRSRQVWWRYTYLWPMIEHKKKIYCKDTENELKSYHNNREQILYWCRILYNGWRRTVLHDERHWSIFTIHRFSGLSWVLIAKRRKFIWTKRLESSEHQDWTRIGSYNLLLTR